MMAIILHTRKTIFLKIISDFKSLVEGALPVKSQYCCAVVLRTHFLAMPISI